MPVLKVLFGVQIWTGLHSATGMAKLEARRGVYSQLGSQECDHKNNPVLLQIARLQKFFHGVSCSNQAVRRNEPVTEGAC